MTIKKAVIAVAGFGTRFLPATKNLPKELMPIVDRPVVQYLVDHGASVNAKTKTGKTPLAMAEGTVIHMSLVVRPSTVALLRKIGGVDK